MPSQSGSRYEPDRHDPLLGIARLLLDGTNLLHALRTAPEPPPAATLIGRLRGVIPPAIQIVLVFDGRGEGVGTSRLASGLTVRYSARETADRVIERLAAEEPTMTLVVTDDRELARSVRNIGGSSIGNSWLLRRLAVPRLRSPVAGRPRPPVGGAGSPGLAPSEPTGVDARPDPVRDASAALDSRRWRPGRGSTRKRGNPRRGHPPDGEATGLR